MVLKVVDNQELTTPDLATEFPKKHHVTRKRKSYDQVEMERNLRMLVKTEKEKKEEKKEKKKVHLLENIDGQDSLISAPVAAPTPKKDTPLSKPKVFFLIF